MNIQRLKPEEYTNFEQISLITKRAEDIELRDHPPLIEIGDVTDSKIIALMEFKKGVLPYILIREFPDGSQKEYKMINAK